MRNKLKKVFRSLLMLILVVSVWYLNHQEEVHEALQTISNFHLVQSYSNLDDIPEWNGTDAYVFVNDNVPVFDTPIAESYIDLSSLDLLGRCGPAEGCFYIDDLPTEARGDISSVKPSGWQSIPDETIDGGWLYNRCHLIAYMISGLNDEPRNLITGTRYMNIEGMLPFENLAHDAILSGDVHVMYRVTPVFSGTELICRGVQMEAYSVEDSGYSVQFNVFCYNVQPGWAIVYADGSALKS